MTPITSKDNPKLQELRRLARRSARDRAQRFVAEGEDLLAGADAAGWRALTRLCAAGSGLAGDEVEPDLLAQASGLGSGTRTAAIYECRWGVPAGPLAIELHGVGDPGNVGTIVRSALAFGVASVVLGPDCADPFGPNAERASMGAIFEMPVARLAQHGPAPGERVALVARSGEELRLMPDAPGGRVLLVGSERDGLPQDVIDTADRIAHIPIATESLNAAMAATIGLYECSNRIAAP